MRKHRKANIAQSLIEYAVLIATIAAAVSLAAVVTRQAFVSQTSNIEKKYGSP